MGTLPAGENAYVDPVKIAGYLLNPHHRIGRHKARVFASVLGLTHADAGEFIAALKHAAATAEAQPNGIDVYGARYVIEFDLVRGSKTARLRSSWIVRHGEDFPRLVTALVAKRDLQHE